MAPESVLLIATVVGFWLRDTWQVYIFFRQWSVVNNATSVPETFKRFISDVNFSIIRRYNLDVLSYAIVYFFFDFVRQTVVLLLYILSFLWICSGNVAKLIHRENSEIWVSIIFMMMLKTVDTLITLPLNIFFQFRIENRYHAYKESFLPFLVGKAIVHLLAMLWILVYIPALVFIVRFTGHSIFIYLSILQIIIAVLYNTVCVNVSLLLSDMKPLEDGELKTAIENLASRVGFPHPAVYVYKASKRTSEANASLYGFGGNVRIVLFDTLINMLTVEEVVAVVAHELGHWKNNHVAKLLILYEVHFLSLIVMAYFLFESDLIYEAFNFYNTKPVIIGLVIIYDYLVIPVDYCFTFLHIALSRHFEYKADAFAANLGLGKTLGSALTKVERGNFVFPVTDRLYSTFTYDHPTLEERREVLLK